MNERRDTLVVITSLTMTIAIVVVYSIFLFQRDVALSAQLGVLQRELKDAQRNIVLDNDIQNKRLATLEAELPPDAKTARDDLRRRVLAIERSAWQRNRDAEIRARLLALEQWRLRTGGGQR